MNNLNIVLSITLIIIIMFSIIVTIWLFYTNSYNYKEKQFKLEMIDKLQYGEITEFDYARMLDYTDKNKIFKVSTTDTEYIFNLKDFSNIQISTTELKKDQ